MHQRGFCFLFLMVFLCNPKFSSAQNLTARVYGVVKGSDKKTLTGVSIGILGTATGVVSDESGNFSMLVP